MRTTGFPRNNVVRHRAELAAEDERRERFVAAISLALAEKNGPRATRILLLALEDYERTLEEGAVVLLSDKGAPAPADKKTESNGAADSAVSTPSDKGSVSSIPRQLFGEETIASELLGLLIPAPPSGDAHGTTPRRRGAVAPSRGSVVDAHVATPPRLGAAHIYAVTESLCVKYLSG